MAPQLGAPADPSPKGWKMLAPDRLVGLAIVAALGSNPGERSPPSSVVVSVSSPISIGRACPEAPESREPGGFRVADFLSCCHLCGKRLHGKDIYMYRGEKAFCSIECRCQQIVSDEYQEICGAEAARPAAAEASSSPYSGGGSRRIFFPGIVVS